MPANHRLFCVGDFFCDNSIHMSLGFPSSFSFLFVHSDSKHAKPPIYINQDILMRGDACLVIFMQSPSESKELYRFFLKENQISERDDLIKVEKIGSNFYITISNTIEKEKIHHQLKKYFLTKKKEEWCRKILKEEFFYTDEEEQNQIIEMIHTILDGKKRDLPVHINHIEDEQLIDHALLETLKLNTPFSFDAFIKFRLKDYLNNLSNYVEIAIDEYKLEQDYQLFIQTLREFLKGRKPLIEEIQLVDEDGFTFYNEKFEEMKRSELFKTIDRKLLSNHPIYVDSTTIAPLLSISPLRINIFTNNSEQGIIRTIMNIFEERICLYPFSEFDSIRKKRNFDKLT